MVALIILGIIVGIIVLISLIPVGADVAYESGELAVSAKVMGVLIKVFPRPPKDPNAPEKPPKEKKPKKPKKQKNPSDGKPKKKLKLSFTKEEIFALVKKVMQGLGKFRKMRIDRFKLHYIAGGTDPYNTAVTYGYVNSALSALAPLGVERFHVDDCDIYTNFDFAADKTNIDFGIALSIRIGQIFAVINTIVFGALGILIKNRWRLFRERRRNRKNGAEPEAAPEQTEENNKNINTENSQAEERND